MISEIVSSMSLRMLLNHGTSGAASRRAFTSGAAGVDGCIEVPRWRDQPKEIVTVADHDDQEFAEMFDEEALGGDEVNPTHHELMGPDEGGDDDVSELIATSEDAEGPMSPEERAVHRR